MKNVLLKFESIIEKVPAFVLVFIYAGFIYTCIGNPIHRLSELHQNIYFAGEIVNIDAITGGFNFQNAWTSGFILANNI